MNFIQFFSNALGITEVFLAYSDKHWEEGLPNESRTAASDRKVTKKTNRVILLYRRKIGIQQQKCGYLLPNFSAGNLNSALKYHIYNHVVQLYTRYLWYQSVHYGEN
jgi:hypothetical protein